jgi:hypothetical protein
MTPMMIEHITIGVLAFVFIVLLILWAIQTYLTYKREKTQVDIKSEGDQG